MRLTDQEKALEKLRTEGVEVLAPGAYIQTTVQPKLNAKIGSQYPVEATRLATIDEDTTALNKAFGIQS